MTFPALAPKDPDDVKDYMVDWSDWLGTDTISTTAWTISSGLTKDSDTNSSTGATIWLSGGTAGDTYQLSNRITTAGGRTADRTFVIECKEL